GSHHVGSPPHLMTAVKRVHRRIGERRKNNEDGQDEDQLEERETGACVHGEQQRRIKMKIMSRKRIKSKIRSRKMARLPLTPNLALNPLPTHNPNPNLSLCSRPLLPMPAP